MLYLAFAYSTNYVSQLKKSYVKFFTKKLLIIIDCQIKSVSLQYYRK